MFCEDGPFIFFIVFFPPAPPPSLPSTTRVLHQNPEMFVESKKARRGEWGNKNADEI